MFTWDNGFVIIAAGMNEAHKFRCAINVILFPNTSLNYFDSVREAGNFNLSLFDGSPSSPGLC